MKQIHFESIDSTNTYLKNNYQNLENLTFVSASNQTQGRGRNNRVWDSEENNLLFSLLIKDPNYFSKINELSIVSAYTILEVLKEYGIDDVSIKWPNDVYVMEKKICGVLLEAVTINDIECVIIGVGLNVNQIKFNEEYLHKPISMKEVLNQNIDVEKLKTVVYKKIIDNLNMIINGYDFYSKIIKYDYLQNKEAYALINDKKELVKVIGINKDFTLCVKLNDSEFNLNSGEISFHF